GLATAALLWALEAVRPTEATIYIILTHPLSQTSAVDELLGISFFIDEDSTASSQTVASAYTSLGSIWTSRAKRNEAVTSTALAGMNATATTPSSSSAIPPANTTSTSISGSSSGLNTAGVVTVVGVLTVIAVLIITVCQGWQGIWQPWREHREKMRALAARRRAAEATQRSAEEGLLRHWHRESESRHSGPPSGEVDLALYDHIEDFELD
ncbi:hypothetical protein FRB97_007713, partial [Tulasnella sp. 331]